MGSRRNFFKQLVLGASVAPAVKSVAVLPDHQSEKFAAGFATRPLTVDYLSKLVNVHDATAYDRIRLKAGTRVPLRLRFFQTPLGQSCPYSNEVKTACDTSMFQAGQLCAPWELLAHRILFAVHPSADERDLSALNWASSWEFKLGFKIIHRGPVLLNTPARAELAAIVEPEETRAEAHSTRLTREKLPESVLASAHTNALTVGIYVPSVCWFGVDIETPGDVILHADLDLLIGLQGLESVGVQ
jgi:hypothetical protein